MADEANLNEELGGIVTTVKTQDTSDLDVLALLEANKAELEAAGQQPPAEEKPAEKVVEEKKDEPGEKKVVAPTGEQKKEPVVDEDDEDKPIDFKSLSEQDQKLVARAFKQQRNKNKKEVGRLRAENEQLQSELAGKKGTATQEEKPKPVQVQQPVRPRRKDFAAGDEGDEKFDAAMAAHEDAMYKFRKQQEAESEAAERQAEADKKLVAGFNEAAEKFMETHADYEEVMESEVPLTPIMFGYMVEEQAPELGYFWAQNEEWVERVSRLSPRKQEKEIIKLHLKLQDEAEAEAAKKAEEEAEAKKKGEKKDVAPKGKEKPEPIKPVGGRNNTVAPKDPSKMSFKEREKEYARTHPGALNYEP